MDAAIMANSNRVVTPGPIGLCRSVLASMLLEHRRSNVGKTKRPATAVAAGSPAKRPANRRGGMVLDANPWLRYKNTAVVRHSARGINKLECGKE
jgi:hypothetical protein